MAADIDTPDDVLDEILSLAKSHGVSPEHALILTYLLVDEFIEDQVRLGKVGPDGTVYIDGIIRA